MDVFTARFPAVQAHALPDGRMVVLPAGADPFLMAAEGFEQLYVRPEAGTSPRRRAPRRTRRSKPATRGRRKGKASAARKPPRTPGRAKRPASRATAPALVARIQQPAREGLSPTEIAAKAGCSWPTAKKYARGVKPGGKAASPTPAPSEDPGSGPSRRCTNPDCGARTKSDPCHVCGSPWDRTR